ncbi:UDP-N-acetylglucosamine 2-epimerase [Deferribacter desulfuricans SSM1]|uniref:UDP-N-acetylglucosamine 2-epimerase n=1 Tax=Deferribacter desulfuricans (strain DSM 14783 / JCM 11476 / NBRC 101012 / SSM1) TaxID=639282 RepID=D3PB96_DEFDS|nr:UDP-N-acetylglucosamine 2-epimerase [Deferribacter desulfuricans]BAI79869.1 UDP-N-acetylglucosamine 2-epimerase [Deferribacter desulfuricans SSM1]
MKKKKVLACTSIRSDYDLLSPLYKLLHEDNEIDFRILVSGAHLSHQHGYSIEQIRKDGFEILLEIETLLSYDTKISRVKTASLLLQNSLETIAKFNPDLIIYAGDREDTLVYAMIGGYLRIPTIHFYGGDHVKDGYIDNPVRHAVSKLSTVHFVAIQEHKKRLIRMGEHPKRIFVVGNIALDRFLFFKELSKAQIKDKFNIKFGFDKFALVIFHPIVQEEDKSHIYFENILKVLKEKNICAFVSYPNTDPNNHKLINIINQYKQHPNFIFYNNLERDLFLSIYKNAEFIIGNSSSGIYEAASFKIPAINIGMRQIGRYCKENVIFSKGDLYSIKKSIEKATSENFLKIVRKISNPYGDGKSAFKAYNLIKNIDFKTIVDKKEDPLEIPMEDNAFYE